jgi:hypothetical protein
VEDRHSIGARLLRGLAIELVVAAQVDHRLTVVHADAYKWMPAKQMRWHVVWHDIWDEICADNLKQMAKFIADTAIAAMAGQLVPHRVRARPSDMATK